MLGGLFSAMGRPRTALYQEHTLGAPGERVHVFYSCATRAWVIQRGMEAEVRHLVEAWHWMYFETDLAFGGLSPQNLHRRPGPGLLAISEHVAHVVRSEASIINRGLFGQSPRQWEDCLLRQPEFGWPPTMLEGPINPELERMSVDEVMDAYLRQHSRCYELAQTCHLSPDHVFKDHWERCTTVRDRLRIAAYHVAYHTGQIYSARHLLGEETPEN